MKEQTHTGLYRRMLVRLAVVAAGAALLLTVGLWVFRLLLPFLAAWLVAWALSGVAAALRKRIRLSHKAAAMLITVLLFLCGAAALGYLSWRVASEAMELSQSWQSILENFSTWMETVSSQMRRLTDQELRLLDQFNETLQSAISGLADSISSGVLTWVSDWAKQIPAVALGVVVFAFATFLITADYANLHEKFAGILSRDPNHPIHTVKHILKGVFGDYLGRLLTACILVTFIDLFGLLILKVQYAALLAIVMGVLDFLPYLGSGTILLPWGVVCLLGGQPLRGLGLLLLYGAVRVFRGYYAKRFIPNREEFGNFGVLICVFLGWKLWGAAGIILGPVVVMILISLYHNGFFDASLDDLRLAYSDIRRRMGLSEESEP